MKYLVWAAILALFGPALAAEPDEAVREFRLPELATPPPGSLRRVYATFYYAMEIVPDEDAAIPLLDTAGRALGPKLGEVQFCEAAMEGTVIIAGSTYNVTGTGRERQANCRRVFSRLARRFPVVADALSRSRFARTNASFGLGVHGFRLLPGRTIATDPTHIATGTVVYLPSLRGRRIAGGALHDGYLFAADVGGAIRGDHIDYFAGLKGSTGSDLSFTSSPDSPRPLDAYVVADPAIAAALERAHRIH